MAEESQQNPTTEASSIPIYENRRKAPRFLCVDYPGVVKNVEKAIDTLGGLNKMAHDHYKMAALELDYHRENIYSRPALSRRRAGTFLIVKARRKKPQSVPPDAEAIDDDQGQAQDPAKHEEIEAEILGLVSSMHRFCNMFDFQFLPVKRASTAADQRQTYEDLLPKLFPTNLKSMESEWLPEPSSSTSDMDLFLPPYAFSRFSLPSFLVLGREPQQLKPTKGSITASNSSVVGLSLRKDRRFVCFMLQGHEPFPTEPHPTTVSQADEKCKLSMPHDFVKATFEERPLWSKSAVMVKTGLEENLLKCLLPKYAFYILSGPFGRLWCRFGYDPRKDRSAVIYQTIMINLSKMGLRTSDALRIGYKVPAANRLKVTSRGGQLNRDGSRAMKPKENWFVYKPDELPPFRQVWYQITDVKLPVVDEEIQKALAVEDPVFRDGHSESTGAGWLLPGASDRIREAIKDNLKQLLDKLDKEMPRTRPAVGERGAPSLIGSEGSDSSDDEADEDAIQYVKANDIASEQDMGEHEF